MRDLGQIMKVNTASVQLLGYSKTDLEGNNISVARASSIANGNFKCKCLDLNLDTCFNLHAPSADYAYAV
jgi:hypothetical protein